MRVLVVDDEELVRQTIAMALELDGFDICEAQDGREAVQLVQANLMSGERIALAIIDANMPGISGFDTMRTIREICPMPVIIISGEPEIIAPDADALFIKPFKQGDLLAAVRCLLACSF